MFTTVIYLYKLDLNTKKLVLNLSRRSKINFPILPYPVLNTSITLFKDHFAAVARVSNAGFEDKPDLFGRPVQLYLKEGSKLQNGIIKFDLFLDGTVSNLEFIHDISVIPNYEDPRIFINNGIEFIVMTQVKSPVGKSTSPWKSNVVLENISSRQITILPSPYSKGIEKNWVPVDIDDSLTLLYGSNPIVMIKLDEKQLFHEFVFTKNKSQLILNNRTQVVKTDHPKIPYIRVASKKYATSKFGYTPLHYFEILSKNMQPIGLSKPFIFSSRKQEFCQGIAFVDSVIYLCWSEQEKYNFIGSIEIDGVIKLFPEEMNLST